MEGGFFQKMACGLYFNVPKLFPQTILHNIQFSQISEVLMIQWMQNHRKLLNSSYAPLHCLEVLFPASVSELQSIAKGQKNPLQC